MSKHGISVQNCFEYTFKSYTFENVTSVLGLAAMYVLPGMAVTECEDRRRLAKLLLCTEVQNCL